MKNEDDTFLALKRTPAVQMWKEYAPAYSLEEEQAWLQKNGWNSRELIEAWNVIQRSRDE